MDEIHELIALRAYELWERAGRQGSEMDHWLEAERQVRMEQSGNKPADAAIHGGGAMSPVEGGAADEEVIEATAADVTPPAADAGENLDAAETGATEQKEPLK